jgi:uncharacterized protein YbjT (DUF2867 family)
MPAPTILVAGATGMLGSAVARRLLADGIPVRALGRSRDRLQHLADAGAETVAVDLRDADAVADACRGIAQLVSTVNNAMGHGASSPNRVDLPAYRTLATVARRGGITRWLHVSARGLTADSIVDYFRVKTQIDHLVRASGIPFVLLQPSAFMEVWIDLILGGGIERNGTAVLFGDGRRICNYIAVDDVASMAVAILSRPEIRNEAIECGGPSNVDCTTLVGLLERAIGRPVRRRHIPVLVLRLGGILLRPFNEAAARRMTLGAFSAMADAPFLAWRQTADRLGVTPRTVERYILERYAKVPGSQPPRSSSAVGG